MKKQIATTLQQKLGFLDEDLKKLTHDKLMLWLDDNIHQILNENLPKSLNYLFHWGFVSGVKSRISQAIEIYQKEENNEKIEYLTSLNLFEKEYIRDDVKIISKVWEYPIKVYNNNKNSVKQIVGFIDFAVTYEKAISPILEGIKYKNNTYHVNELKDIEGIEDELSIDFKYERKTVFIEVKTEIKSLGELIRQINLYKEHLPGDYFVLCPDDSYKKILYEQQIYFIEYGGKEF